MVNILIVSPHPDDAELGCGGMIHKRSALGDKITVAVCTSEGDLKMVHSNEIVKFKQRQAEQIAALNVLGNVDLVWLDLAPASAFDQTPQAKFVTAFDSFFKDFDEVYLPLPSYNEDHCIVWRAGLAAFRPGKIDNVSLIAYEQPIQGHGEQVFGPIACKRYLVLSKDDIKAKVKSLKDHKSQMAGREQSLTGPGGAVALALFRGAEIGHRYAEMFYPVREVLTA